VAQLVLIAIGYRHPDMETPSPSWTWPSMGAAI